jgi:tetratricopeptide (TPR) repeat protein
MAGTARRMRVGVLPFSANGSEGGNALALAYARDTALELARFRRFDVISPLGLTGMGASSVPFDADLDYVVDGSLRGLDGSPHLVMSLLDVSELARPVWSERIALTESGAREVQGEAVQSLVARLDPAILFAEGTRSVVPAQRSDATCLVLRSIPMLYSMRQDRFEMAGELLAEAVAREPENAMAAAWAAHWHVFYIGQGWARNPLAALQEAERLAVLAMQLDPENAEGYGIYGHVCSFLHKDFDSAAYYLERSLSMNPNQASIWAMSAPTHCYLGNPGEALRRLDRYRSLAPFHPHAQIFEPMFTVAHTFGGDFEQAAAVGRRAVRASPDFTNAYKPLLSAMGHLGQKREARPYLEGLMRREPGFNVRDFIRNYPFRLAEDRERYAEGLRLAGVPKG